MIGAPSDLQDNIFGSSLSRVICHILPGAESNLPLLNFCAQLKEASGMEHLPEVKDTRAERPGAAAEFASA